MKNVKKLEFFLKLLLAENGVPSNLSSSQCLVFITVCITLIKHMCFREISDIN